MATLPAGRNSGEPGNDADKARHIEGDGKELVKITLQEFDIKEQIGEIGLNDDERRADKEQYEAPEKEAVQQAGPGHVGHFFLQQDIFQHIADTPLPLVGPVERQALLIHLHPSPESPYQETNRDDGEQVHGHKRCRAVSHIPVDFSRKFHGFLQLSLSLIHLVSALPITIRCTSLVPS